MKSMVDEMEARALVVVLAAMAAMMETEAALGALVVGHSEVWVVVALIPADTGYRSHGNRCRRNIR